MGLAGVGLMGGGLAVFAFQFWRVLRKATRAAREGVEAECKLLRVEDQVVNGRATGHRLYHFLVPDRLTRGVRVEAKESFLPKRGVALLLDGGQSLLALVPPNAPEQSLALRADLFPLDLDPGTAEAIQQAASKRAAPRNEGSSLAEAS
jgi:hypothetical protein